MSEKKFKVGDNAMLVSSAGVGERARVAHAGSKWCVVQRISEHIVTGNVVPTKFDVFTGRSQTGDRYLETVKEHEDRLCESRAWVELNGLGVDLRRVTPRLTAVAVLAAIKPLLGSP